MALHFLVLQDQLHFKLLLILGQVPAFKGLSLLNKLSKHEPTQDLEGSEYLFVINVSDMTTILILLVS